MRPSVVREGTEMSLTLNQVYGTMDWTLAHLHRNTGSFCFEVNLNNLFGGYCSVLVCFLHHSFCCGCEHFVILK